MATLDLYPTNHLLILSPGNPFRKLCVKVSNSRAFDTFILLAITVNCIMMAMNAPLPNEDKSQMNIKIEELEIYLLSIFIGESFFKIVSQGFILHPYSYMRNAWNILDFTVVLTGVLGMPELGVFKDGDAGFMKVIKAARVLRPLKLVSGVPSLQVVMSAILKSVASLLNIFLLIVFVMVIYAIVFMTLLLSKFHYTCVYNGTNIIAEDGRLCGDGGRPCPDGTMCSRYWDGPNDGVTSYDNIFIAVLTVFVCITCEGWTDTMYWSFDVADYSGRYLWIIYFSLNIIGSQFMLNLVCGVLSGEFSKENERVENRAIFLREREAERMEMAEERAEEKYDGWINEGEIAQAAEEEKILEEEAAAEGEDGEIQLTAREKFVMKINVIRTKLKAFMLSSFMYWVVIFVVFLNSLSGIIQHYGQPQWISDIIALSDLIFLGFFCAEMCLKFFACGPTLYFKSKFNKFDFVVVVAGLGNLTMSKLYNINLGIPVLRQLRLMRLFKFTQYWPALKNLVKSIIASMSAIMSLLLLLFLFLMIFALLGMTLFAGTFNHRMEPARTNFDDFFNAMLAVFQIITGEDWNFVMYEGVVAHGGPKTPTGLALSLYFIAVTLLGNYVILNVFLAIAVDNLTMTSDEEVDAAAEEAAAEAHMGEVKEKYAPPGEDVVIEIGKDEGGAVEAQGQNVVQGEFDTVPVEGGMCEPGDGFLENLKQPGRMTGRLPVVEGVPMIQANTLFICFPESPFRKILHTIVTSPYFDNVILALILISSMLLAVEDAKDPNAEVNNILKFCDYGFTAIFAMEVVVKVINYGFVLHPGSYCRDSWNCADMFVVVCAITSLVLGSNKDASPTIKSIVQFLRILRVLRPLKSINKLPKLKAVFQCMIFSLKNVFNILIIILQFLVIFSVMGIQLFSGKLQVCNDKSKEYEDECQGTFITFDEFDYHKPVVNQRQWSRLEFNFDYLGYSMMTLFTSATGEGWPAVMQSGIDSQEEDQGPILNSKLYVALYFLIFVIIFSFFFINVFVGMIILTFQEQAAANDSGELDRNEKNSIMFSVASKPMERFMPEDVKSWQYKAWAVMESAWFEFLIMTLISLNTIVLMLDFEDQSESFQAMMAKFNEFFAFIFVFEFAIKYFALGCNYWKDGWNNFDLVIVLGSLLDFIIKKFLPPGTIPIDTSIFRLCRAARLIKLLRRFRSLRILLWTFLQSFKALPYVGMLITLLFFVYGIIGMQIFPLISIDMGDEDPYAQINRNNHFRSFFSSLQVIFRVSSGENWPNIMIACGPGAVCDKALKAVPEGQEYCGTPVAYLYYISFVFLCSFLMMNLFIAVIMDSFAFLTEDSSILGPHHLDEFNTVWSDFDPCATGRIKHTEVCELLRQMLPPVGLGLKCPRVVAYKRLVQMNMTLYKDGSVNYNGTFFALVRTGLQIRTKDANLKATDQSLRKLLKATWPNMTKRTLDLIIPRTPRNAQHMTIAKVYAAKLIWENYKNMKSKGQRRKSIYPTGKVTQPPAEPALEEAPTAEADSAPAALEPAPASTEPAAAPAVAPDAAAVEPAAAPAEEAEVTRTSRQGDRKTAETAPPPPGAFVNEGAEPDEDWC